MDITTENLLPFWGANVSQKGGRDPLGVQNSSVVIYSNMITGITNVTLRVRYNGFFCWLITLIAERLQQIDSSKTDNAEEQIKYIRRGELILAYAMLYNYPQATGVSGSIYAERHFNEDVIDLALGADYFPNKKGYWKNRLGIFGQYYIGVLSQLKLINLPDNTHNTYRVTNSKEANDGMMLNKSFKMSLTDGCEDLFWDAIYTGRIEKEKLADLQYLALHIINNDAELRAYEKIFCKPDRQGLDGKDICHRIESIKLLLRFIANHGTNTPRKETVLSFLRDNFEMTISQNLLVSDESLSWFMYELNELAHAAYEAFHFAILYTVNKEPRPLDIVLDELKQDFYEYKQQSSNSNKPYELYKKLQHCYKERQYGACILEASRLIGCLMGLINSHIDNLVEQKYARDGNKYDVSHTGFAPTLLLRLTDGYNDVESWEFAEYCLYHAINAHQYSSYKKSTINQGLVHNYIVDDGLIWWHRGAKPIRTSPRLLNVLLYIEDMHWIERYGDYYRITERGKKIMTI